MQRFSLFRYFTAVSSKVQGTVKVRNENSKKFQIEIQPAPRFASDLSDPGDPEDAVMVGRMSAPADMVATVEPAADAAEEPGGVLI